MLLLHRLAALLCRENSKEQLRQRCKVHALCVHINYRINCAAVRCREIIKEQLLPNAVRWYTGEALAEDHDGDDDGSMSDDDEEGESGEDEVDNEDDEVYTAFIVVLVPRWTA